MGIPIARLLCVIPAITLVALSVLYFKKYNNVKKMGEDIEWVRKGEFIAFPFRIKGNGVKKYSWQYKYVGFICAVLGLAILIGLWLTR